MNRANIFIAGTVLVLLTVLALVISVLVSQSATSNDAPADYASFSGSTQTFESLETKTKNRAAQEAAQAAFLNSWQENISTSTKSAAYYASQGTSPTNNYESLSSHESSISDDFRSLVGESLLDKASAQYAPGEGSGGYSYDPYDSGLWFDGFNDTYAPTTQTDSETATQAALRKYGNTLGQALTAFNTTHSDQVDVLDAFIKNRDDTSALKQLTDDYVGLAEAIGNIQASGPIVATHERLGPLYKNIGERLWNLSSAETDEELLADLLAYNAVAEDVARAHVKLVKTFTAYGVVFEDYEAGSIFSFTPPYGSELVE